MDVVVDWLERLLAELVSFPEILPCVAVVVDDDDDAAAMMMNRMMMVRTVAGNTKMNPKCSHW